MSHPSPPASTRRNLLAGAGAVGAAAVAVSVVPMAQQAAVPAVGAAASAAADMAKDGYQVTAHVLRYYQTARV